MRQYIEPFVVAPIITQRTEEEITSYYDGVGKLLAEAYFNDGEFYSAVFYGTNDRLPITKEQAEKIAKHVKMVFQQERLQLITLLQLNNEFIVEFQMVEPIYNLPIRGSGMNLTISATGFVEEVTLNDNDVIIDYPEKMVSKEEAKAILQQQCILKLGIAPELGWQYVYKQNYDLGGIAPDGNVRLWSEDDSMQDASFEQLPKADSIADFEVFLKGGRNATVEFNHTEEEKRWVIESDEHIQLEEDVFLRACKVVKHLVGDAYEDYYVEQYPTLRKLLDLEDDAFVTFRFVYIYNDISFDFQALSISVDTESNQIMSVTYPLIPFEMFPALPYPTLTEEEANKIAQQLIDVELLLENDLYDSKKRTFTYSVDYPSSPTGGHIQYVDGFTGEIHWVETGW